MESLSAEGETPAPLRDRPELPERLAPLYEAFGALGGDRHLGVGGAGAIPFLAIDAYARRYRIEDADQFRRFHVLLTRMDAAYLEWAAERARKPAET
ncbi:phage tail assembly chaperone [Methylosinus sp. LW4]|uniref:phage tail assembly chaperone n=1 Tax=Methylosinus sp. LW4 TaxID=136993 RepID=UPI00403784C3